ncbi:MAG: hypothetical protein M0Z43_11295, partial [Acidithiobacillus sp.]|nr:hypothetical protein [Acidithiobacillus sp.]
LLLIGGALLFIVAGAFMAISTAINKVIDLLYGWGQAIGDLIVWFSQIPQHLQTLAGWFTNIFSTIDGALTSFETTVNNAFSAIGSTISNAFTGVVSGVADTFATLLATVQTGVVTVTNFLAELPGRILTAIGDLGKLLVGAGKALMQGLLDGITEGAGWVKDKLVGLKDDIVGWKGPPDVDAILLIPAGNLLMEGLVKGINQKTGLLKSALGDVTTMIQGPMAPSRPVSSTSTSTQYNQQRITVVLPNVTDYAAFKRSMETDIRLNG